MKKKLVVDFDTPIISAAAVCQYNYIAKHSETGDEIPIESKKKFFEKFKDMKDREDEVEFIKQATLIPDDGDFKIEFRAYKSINDSVKRLENLSWASPVTIVVGGEGNFRMDVAKTWPYKGTRTEKPLLTDKVKQYVKKKYSFQVESVDGVETDDVVSWYGWESYQEAKQKRDKKAAPTVIAHVDKDLNMIPGWHCDLKGDNLRWISEDEGMKFFFWQLLAGDKTVDNIPGLNGISDEIIETYGLRRVRSMGKGTADKIIEACPNSVAAWKAVLHCYKVIYPDSWQTYMQEQADLLWMQRYPGSRFIVEEYAEMTSEKD